MLGATFSIFVHLLGFLGDLKMEPKSSPTPPPPMGGRGMKVPCEGCSCHAHRVPKKAILEHPGRPKRARNGAGASSPTPQHGHLKFKSPNGDLNFTSPFRCTCGGQSQQRVLETSNSLIPMCLASAIASHILLDVPLLPSATRVKWKGYAESGRPTCAE